ncbi:hypothetical protein FVE85_3611 [Porphyridium purpureum]|uniref:Uncharacterized protein n=1 Tax=Porphyridium purpureum TaxID=35688 RepID=A0A5J4YNB4_PORPP|nr:hypothetical protein FVE85_3611 [Porphyridium purpureum]|eukprot:POR0537..scf249_10
MCRWLLPLKRMHVEFGTRQLHASAASARIKITYGKQKRTADPKGGKSPAKVGSKRPAAVNAADKAKKTTRKKKNAGFDFELKEWPAFGEPSDKQPVAEDNLEGPFYAVRGGRDSFRGVVLNVLDYKALVDDITYAEGRSKKTLAEAIDWSLKSRQNRSTCSQFFAFRNGLDGARGITVASLVLKGALSRVSSPSLEKFRFCNMTQALVFCQQAGTSNTDWHTLEGSVRYLAKHPNVFTQDLVAEFVVRKVQAALRKGRLDTLQKPFFAVRGGVDSFRGIVLHKKHYVALMEMARRAEGRSVSTLEKAMEFCLATEPNEKACTRFFAFRNGLQGARGIALDKQELKSLVARVRTPWLEIFKFNNMTQALVFCEQAAIKDSDWSSLEDSVRYLSRRPSRSTLTLIAEFVVRKNDARLVSRHLLLGGEALSALSSARMMRVL